MGTHLQEKSRDIFENASSVLGSVVEVDQRHKLLEASADRLSASGSDRTFHPREVCFYSLFPPGLVYLGSRTPPLFAGASWIRDQGRQMRGGGGGHPRGSTGFMYSPFL